MDIFQEKSMFFKLDFSHTKQTFLLNFTLIDREMFKLYEYKTI